MGQLIDGWTLGRQSAPDGTPGIVRWMAIYFYVTTDPFATTGFVASPPPGADLVVFQFSVRDDTAT